MANNNNNNNCLEEYESTLRAFIISALNRREKVKQPDESSSFSHSAWTHRTSELSTLLSHASAKFTVICRSVAEDPSACSGAIKSCNSLSSCLFQLIDALEALPVSRGQTLSKDVCGAARELLSETATLANGFLREPVPSRKAPCRGALADTGAVWASAETIKNLPRTNREAVLRRWGLLIEQLEDAARELDEALFDEDPVGFGWDQDEDEEEDDNNDSDVKNKAQGSGLTDAQQERGTDIAKMLKLATLVMKKIATRCIQQPSESDEEEKEGAEHLDALLKTASAMISKADDVVACFEDMDPSNQDLIDLSNECSNLVQLAGSRSEEPHTSWFQKSETHFRQLKEQWSCVLSGR